MSRPARSPNSPLALLGLALAMTAGLASSADAQSLYTLNEKGRLSVNATLLDSLPGSKWLDLVVDGPDRYAIRNNGRVYKNGIELYKLNCDTGNNNKVNEGDWIGIELVDGELWALSDRGYVARGPDCVGKLDEGDYHFVDFFAGSTDGMANVWSLRSDGFLYVNTVVGPIFQFEGNPGIDEENSGEGEAQDTEWVSGTVKASNGNIFAMRADGTVVVGTFAGGGGTPLTGTIVAELPFGSSTNLYKKIVFIGNDTWDALRGNGRVYNQKNTLEEQIDLNDSSSRFSDILPLPVDMEIGTTDTSFMALRRDGKLYCETAESSVAEVSKGGFGTLGLSLDAPDLTNNKNALPKVSKYTVNAISGTGFTVPILATDTDKVAEELVVTVDPETMPEGATYDPMARTITWDDPVKGSYSIKTEVNDGVGNPVKTTFKVKVKDPSTKDKNTKPKASAIKNTQGMVSFELRVPLITSDADGDPITVTVDETKAPFDRGATFDPMTDSFVWLDPELGDIGNYTIQFMVSDGTATVKQKVKISIVSSVLGF